MLLSDINVLTKWEELKISLIKIATSQYYIMDMLAWNCN